jgi:hypothetical protein
MSAPRETQRCAGEEGQILILALVMLTTVGVVIGAILAFAETNMLTTPIVKSRTDRRYATDAAIEYGIKAIGADATLCASSSEQTIPYTQNVNGRAVALTCQATPSSRLGAAGYAAVVDDLSLNASADAPRFMNGKLYVQDNISITGSTFTVNNGSVLQATCPTTQPSGLSANPTPPFLWQCTTAGRPDPAHLLPPRPPNALQSVPFGGCLVHYPGTYSPTGTPLVLSGLDYFVSGIYYFEDAGNVDVTGSLVGGSPRPDEIPDHPVSGCPTDAQTGGGSGYGVEFILGGTSKMTIKSGATMELFRRYRGLSDPAYTDRISLVAVDAAVPGYKASVPTGAVFEALGHPKIAVHGLVYARTTDVAVDASDDPIFQNGLFARGLTITPTASDDPLLPVDPLLITVQGSNDAQDVVLTATATSPGEAPVTSTVRGQLQADNTGSSLPRLFVESWRTG